MIRKAYIRYREGDPDNVNSFAALKGFLELGVEVAPFHGFGDLDTLDDIGPEVAVCGFVGDALRALDRIGAPRPDPLDYPDQLISYLGRRVWQTSLDQVSVGSFVKPMRHKLFTGRLWNASHTDRMATLEANRDEPVWCSDPVEFVSEFRCFVLEDKVLDVRRYRGDWWRAPDRDVVHSAVMAYSDSPAAYSLDWGVTSDGRTLLVEANDAFALGCYGLEPVLYARMLSARWEQMTSAPR